MHRALAVVIAWTMILAVLLIGTLGFGLRAIFNMDSNLMFVALPLAVGVFIAALVFVAQRLWRATVRLFRIIRPTPRSE